MSVSKEELIKEIKRIYSEQKIMNTVVFKKHQTLGLNDSQCDERFYKFGTLKKLCEENNIPFTNAKKLDPKELEEDLRRVYKEQGTLSVRIYSRYGKFSVTGVKGTYGSFNNMLEQLGYKINTLKNIDKEDVKKDVLDFYTAYGTTSTNIYRKSGKYSQCTIDRLFGSWKNLMDELNLPYQGKVYGKEEIVRQLRDVYNRYGYISKALVDKECTFTYQALSFYYKESIKEGIQKDLGLDFLPDNTQSSGEIVLGKILRLLFGQQNVFEQKTWDWLINSTTGRHMYVDFYVDYINICFEFDGEQHFKETKWFHKNDDFARLKERDSLKEELLKQHGIKLLRFNKLDVLNIEMINKEILKEVMNENK